MGLDRPPGRSRPAHQERSARRREDVLAAVIVASAILIEAALSFLGLGDPLIGRLLAYDSLEQSFREFKVRPDPANEITYANRDRIVVAELDELCIPHPLQPPAG